MRLWESLSYFCHYYTYDVVYYCLKFSYLVYYCLKFSYLVFLGEGGKKKETRRATLEVQISASTNMRSKLHVQLCQHDKAGNANLNFGSKFGGTCSIGHFSAVHYDPKIPRQKPYFKVFWLLRVTKSSNNPKKSLGKIKLLHNLKKTEHITAEA